MNIPAIKASICQYLSSVVYRDSLRNYPSFGPRIQETIHISRLPSHGHPAVKNLGCFSDLLSVNINWLRVIDTRPHHCPKIIYTRGERIIGSYAKIL